MAQLRRRGVTLQAAVTPLPDGGGGLPTEARIENQGDDGTRGRIGNAVDGIRTRGIRSLVWFSSSELHFFTMPFLLWL